MYSHAEGPRHSFKAILSATDYTFRMRAPSELRSEGRAVSNLSPALASSGSAHNSGGYGGTGNSSASTANNNCSSMSSLPAHASETRAGRKGNAAATTNHPSQA